MQALSFETNQAKILCDQLEQGKKNDEDQVSVITLQHLRFYTEWILAIQMSESRTTILLSIQLQGTHFLSLCWPVYAKTEETEKFLIRIGVNESAY